MKSYTQPLQTWHYAVAEIEEKLKNVIVKCQTNILQENLENGCFLHHTLKATHDLDPNSEGVWRLDATTFAAPCSLHNHTQDSTYAALKWVYLFIYSQSVAFLLRRLLARLPGDSRLASLAHTSSTASVSSLLLACLRILSLK